MKFLIDENVGQSVIEYIKKKNYDAIIATAELTERKNDIYEYFMVISDNKIRYRKIIQ